MTTGENGALIQHNVPHIQQRYNWDCGVTCILMLLSEEDKTKFLNNFTKICQKEGFGHTTCTIDLCYLLKRYNIEHCMYTTRQSANTRSLSNLTNYNINTEKVATRISKKFANAPVCGIRIYDGVLSVKDLVSHIAHKGPAIVLVDAGLLSCDLCKHNKLTAEFRRIFGGSYRGHYILIFGVSSSKLLYRDPARSSPFCATTFKRLQAARLTLGTDCDIILIYKKIYTKM
ncbi:protein GUCD1 [Melitaea cinxia]|uniref:protein GUCD1 n=1 Tax=Melitaea cinxia TaxID=113334 RepID=UPI001E26F9A7|nr:protein GUCD1 [Melitaea cinxia]